MRVLILLLAGISSLWSQAGQADLILRAEEAFQTEKYGESANLYQEAAQRGAISGELYYNQGNSWYMGGETNLALLSYLKAEKLLPGDGDIKRNLSFLRAQGGEDLSRGSEGEFLRVLFFWHYDLSQKLRGYFFLFFNGLFWLSLSLFLLHKQKLSLFRWLLPLLGLIVISLAISLGAGGYSLKSYPPGVILHETEARKGDSSYFEEAFNRPLQGGTEFTLVEARGGWYHIKLADGSQGWIPSQMAGLVSYP